MFNGIHVLFCLLALLLNISIGNYRNNKHTLFNVKIDARLRHRLMYFIKQWDCWEKNIYLGKNGLL